MPSASHTRTCCPTRCRAHSSVTMIDPSSRSVSRPAVTGSRTVVASSAGSAALASDFTSATPSSSVNTVVAELADTTAPGTCRSFSSASARRVVPSRGVTTKSAAVCCRTSAARAAPIVAVAPSREPASATVTRTGAATAAVRRTPATAPARANRPTAPGSRGTSGRTVRGESSATAVMSKRGRLMYDLRWSSFARVGRQRVRQKRARRERESRTARASSQGQRAPVHRGLAQRLGRGGASGPPGRGERTAQGDQQARPEGQVVRPDAGRRAADRVPLRREPAVDHQLGQVRRAVRAQHAARRRGERADQQGLRQDRPADLARCRPGGAQQAELAAPPVDREGEGGGHDEDGHEGGHATRRAEQGVQRRQGFGVAARVGVGQPHGRPR